MDDIKKWQEDFRAYIGGLLLLKDDYRGIMEYIEEVPTIEPEPSTGKQEILDYLDTVLHPIISPEHWDVYSELHDMISTLPSAEPDIARDIATIIENEKDMRVILKNAQPESRREWYMKGYRDAQDAALHESCTDCPLYDHDRHRCPRFNKVIPTTIQEILDTQAQRWIPVTERLPEEDDYKPCYGYEDGALWWLNDMGLMGLGWYYPSTGKWAYYNESSGCEDRVGNVIAWMPLPEPYRKGEQDE